MTVSFRLWHRKLGGHVHVRVFSSEFGPATTHGCNGTLIFRESEWPAFRKLLETGALHYSPLDGCGLPPAGEVEFVEDTEREEATA